MTREEKIICKDFCDMKAQLEPENEDIFKAIVKMLEQEPNIGHWIRWYERKDFGLYIENIPHCKCSECGKEYDSHSSQFIKYCSECGAKMDKEG